MNKFHAIKVTVSGRTFASKKEAKRFADLQLLEKAGQIRNLEWQPTFPLIVNGVLVCKYIGDAAYFEDNKRVVEDVKSEPTKTPVYRLKRKLLLALNPGMDHREV